MGVGWRKIGATQINEFFAEIVCCLFLVTLGETFKEEMHASHLSPPATFTS